ncbi:SHOCT domain-containing protein [Thermococcus argininiproducens]|uniref:SHOCT domain-containing protein n=1 Tax=Thermococcus argininiproducens TaxID=2866384 RepID=A0A9E7MBE7_9EURY|nr:SHOCT domain-containing protein [Thermococcus argininiproducens]USH00143.1 SHOCT domain-containing protein [Thermococcus argininiproducens]
MMFENFGNYLVHMGEFEWGWHDMMGFGYFGIVGAIFMLLFWVAIIVAVVWFIKWIIEQSSSGATKTSKNRALEILDEKYARGEIDDEEYERRKRKLLES